MDLSTSVLIVKLVFLKMVKQTETCRRQTVECGFDCELEYFVGYIFCFIV
jgi:hypothetical protein